MENSGWFEKLARVGYGAKGVVYLVIGVLAAMAAFGGGGETTGSSGAVSAISEQPFGKILLVILGIGLLAYTVYRLLCAMVDARGKGDDGKGLAKRAGYLVSAISYGTLGVATFRGSGGNEGGGSGEKKDLAAEVLSWPGGAWLVGLAGVGVIVAGLVQWKNVAKDKYRTKFTLDSYSAKHRGWIERMAVAGLSARGLVFLVIGIFVIVGAWQSDASEVIGTAGALDKLAAQPYGWILLGGTALGLVCYALYCWVRVIWGKF